MIAWALFENSLDGGLNVAWGLFGDLFGEVVWGGARVVVSGLLVELCGVLLEGCGGVV